MFASCVAPFLIQPGMQTRNADIETCNGYCRVKPEAGASCTEWGNTRADYVNTNTHSEPNWKPKDARYSHFPIAEFVNLTVPVDGQKLVRIFGIVGYHRCSVDTTLNPVECINTLL